MSDGVRKYIRKVAEGYIDGEDVDEERDAIWEMLTKEEQDEANQLVVDVFKEWM